MQPKILENIVFTCTPIQHLNFPSVTHIKNYAFGGSKLKTLVVENCKQIGEKAFVSLFDAVRCDVKVCGNINLDNVQNCTKVEKIVSYEQKMF